MIFVRSTCTVIFFTICHPGIGLAWHIISRSTHGTDVEIWIYDITNLDFLRQWSSHGKKLYYKEHLRQWLWITCQQSNWNLPKVVFAIEYGDVIGYGDVIVYQRVLNTSTIHSHHGWFQAAVESSFSLARCLRNLLGCCLSLLLGGFKHVFTFSAVWWRFLSRVQELGFLFSPPTWGNNSIWLICFKMGWFNHQVVACWTARCCRLPW